MHICVASRWTRKRPSPNCWTNTTGALRIDALTGRQIINSNVKSFSKWNWHTWLVSAYKMWGAPAEYRWVAVKMAHWVLWILISFDIFSIKNNHLLLLCIIVWNRKLDKIIKTALTTIYNSMWNGMSTYIFHILWYNLCHSCLKVNSQLQLLLSLCFALGSLRKASECIIGVYYLRIENAEGYVLIAAYLFVCVLFA